MTSSVVGPRVLLKRLREVMAEPQSAQARLDRIVVLIASNMVAEVGSIYLLRADEMLELYATEGLNPSAVHETKLKVGEGLVGVIAEEMRPLNLTDAQSHPAFAYRPETGEEIYHSFLGVPIMRAGHALGVLVVQNKARRRYSEEEVEALLTTSMVLAEIIASGDLEDAAATVTRDLAPGRARHIAGTALAEGIALGHVVLHEPRIDIGNPIADNIPYEKERLTTALTDLRSSIDQMMSRADVARGGEHRDVLDSYRMFAHDRGWAHKMHEAVETGLTAEAAVERVQNDNRSRMLRLTDAYLRERLHDLDDLSNRLLRTLTGHTDTAATGDLPKDAIIVARNMGPAELLDYDRQRVRGLVLEEGTQNSHVAIVARALRIPMVGEAEGILDLIDQGDALIADGDTGAVHVRPSADIEQAYGEKVSFRAERQAQYAKLRDVPAVTADGTPISLLINAGLVVDLPHLDEAGADGIGLFRTELQFMIASTFPRMTAQMDYYRTVMDTAGDKAVVFRSLDIGADKVLPYMAQTKEENPALGWRAIRMALDRPGLLRLQIRALLRAAEGRKLKLMFPMIAEVDEFRRARTLVDQEMEFLRTHGHDLPDKVEVGAMIEVPALVWQLPALLPLTDFVSIGSNDLCQFLFASDRGHPRLAGRYDPLSPVVLKVLREIVELTGKFDVPVTLCGEMAGRPLEAMALIGLGLRSISMAPAAVGPVKSMIMSLNARALQEELMALLDLPDHSIRPKLMEFAARHNIST
ncbi:MAG: phosphoenolpyruvate--protein phosphotransferase [Hyphomicrobiales bacterium]